MRKNVLLTGRNLGQNLALGGWPPASTGLGEKMNKYRLNNDHIVYKYKYYLHIKHLYF